MLLPVRLRPRRAEMRSRPVNRLPRMGDKTQLVQTSNKPLLQERQQVELRIHQQVAVVARETRLLLLTLLGQ
jgi:hypothetical protein